VPLFCVSQSLRLWINSSPRKSLPQRRITSELKDVPINAKIFVDSIKKSTFDRSIDLSNPASPTPEAAAALAYSKFIDLDGLCGAPAKAYIEAVLSGKSSDEARGEAAQIYIEAYNSGERLPEAGSCKDASVAFQTAVASGKDPILAAARAYMASWPGLKAGNPCAAAGAEYVNAILDGKPQLKAASAASRSFSEAFKKLATQGRALKDPACAAATKAYWKALPRNEDTAAFGAAFTAFVDKIFEEGSPAFDPVCLASFDAFLDAYNDGKDVLAANLVSARAFFRAFTDGAPVPADSACAAASKAYANAVLDKPSSPNAAAMIVYINEAIAGGYNSLDPVCAAAATAYFDAYIENESEAEANEAAAVAYIDALEEDPDFDIGSPCGRAAQAYIDEFKGL